MQPFPYMRSITSILAVAKLFDMLVDMEMSSALDYYPYKEKEK